MNRQILQSSSWKLKGRKRKTQIQLMNLKWKTRHQISVLDHTAGVLIAEGEKSAAIEKNNELILEPSLDLPNKRRENSLLPIENIHIVTKEAGTFGERIEQGDVANNILIGTNLNSFENPKDVNSYDILGISPLIYEKAKDSEEIVGNAKRPLILIKEKSTAKEDLKSDLLSMGNLKSPIYEKIQVFNDLNQVAPLSCPADFGKSKRLMQPLPFHYVRRTYKTNTAIAIKGDKSRDSIKANLLEAFNEERGMPNGSSPSLQKNSKVLHQSLSYGLIHSTKDVLAVSSTPLTFSDEEDDYVISVSSLDSPAASESSTHLEDLSPLIEDVRKLFVDKEPVGDIPPFFKEVGIPLVSINPSS